MENNDLISRSDAIKTLLEWVHRSLTEEDGARLTTVVGMLENQPAVDAVPVVHGEIIWKNRKKLVKRYDVEPCCFDAEANPLYHATNKHITEKVAYCHVCKKRMSGDFLNFCDNCGARMDGKEPTNE